ncbi:hypothetical protein BT63DRAFT_456898 [Microthyrium microscopicum]|uniref:Queuosine 5'-phosphate N-glycosylase/hydrolase n=1 Tax=Microthyrium microscopicum TaxID=703497 RepID=A0A6A6U7H4_9PEZI|nr:hypothetical protein BT63DRAFT_456898 [Microthyrium microscopicum]
MSDDEADPELLALLRAHLGLGPRDPTAPPETRVLQSAEYIVDNAVDVALDMIGTRNAATLIYEQMQAKLYSFKKWSEHEMHPKASGPRDVKTLEFVFTVDLLNFCFWPEGEEGFVVEYKGGRWSGYWSLCAALWRALDEGTPITCPDYWHSEDFTFEVLENVFRSATKEPLPLLQERFDFLKQASEVLCKEYDLSLVNLIEDANHSAAGLVNLLADKFACFRDETRFERKTVRLLKRAQIFVADIWAAFEGEGFGRFEDIDKITMFADYRVPQMLHALGALTYSPPLEDAIKRKQEIAPGHSWEVQIRGCSIWCVESIRKLIIRQNPEASVNAILIDYFLYDTVKEIEKNATEEQFPHHRTRSVWY